MPDHPTPPEDLSDLIEFSAQIGSDPLLIQAAGGNTSVKDGAVMWIKASGTQLAEANNKDIFVPVDLTDMRVALENGEARADQPAEFILGGGVLRPSIETSLHSVFAQRVVVHVHCVQTLSHAIRADGEALIKPKLSAFDWCMVPYAKPGANLALSVKERLGPASNVVILANHGLLLAADSVNEAEKLLERVVDALWLSPAENLDPDITGLSSILPEIYAVPAKDHVIHQLALDDARTNQASVGSLYPDHVIFCGIGATVLSLDDVAKLKAEEAPVFVIVPGKGVIIRRDASQGSWALTQCLADVMMRVPGDAELTYLNEQQNYELIDWDAEKYRLALNAT